MNRTYQLCSSSARPSQAPGSPECNAARPEPPSPELWGRYTALLHRPPECREKPPGSRPPFVPPCSSVLPACSILFVFRQQFAQLAWNGVHRNLLKPHLFTIPRDKIVLFAPHLVVELGEIDTAMCTTAFFAGHRTPGNGLRNRKHRLQVTRKMPAGIEQPRTFHAD